MVRLVAEMLMKQANRQRIVWIVGLVALIFAVHPLQTEAVAWISASKILLYTTFALDSLISYLYYNKNHRNIYLILTFVGYILSLMTKEQAIILPLNLVLIDPIINLKGEKLTLQKAECMNQKRPRESTHPP